MSSNPFWVLKMIEPVIKDAETPQQARELVIKWGKSQHPRDAAAALIMIDLMNVEYKSISH